MPDPSTAAAAPPSGSPYNLGYRFLRLFADIRPGEAPKALLLALNVFLLLLAYYILKPLRESLLLVDKDSAVVKSCLGGAQAVLFVFVIKGFSRLASKVPRHVLITWTTSFFISNLVVFFFLHRGGMAIKPMGILFFVWVGIFNYFVIAQFWGFANDLYSDEVGKRTFPARRPGRDPGRSRGDAALHEEAAGRPGGELGIQAHAHRRDRALPVHRPGPDDPPPGRPEDPRRTGTRAWPGPPKRPRSRNSRSRPAAASGWSSRAAISFSSRS